MGLVEAIVGIAAVGAVGYVAYKVLTKPVTICTDGQHNVRGTQCYTCANNRWIPDDMVACNPSLGCDSSKDTTVCASHHLYNCVNNLWVDSGQSCLNPCDLVGQCEPDIACCTDSTCRTDGNNLYSIVCNPDTGNCDTYVLQALDSSTCYDRAPYQIQVSLRSTGESILGMGAERPIVSNFYRDLLIYSSIQSPHVKLKVEVLDRAFRPVPNVRVAIVQQSHGVGGFYLSETAGGAVTCSGYTTIETGADGVVIIDPTWVCLKDQGASVISDINWTFTCGTVSVQGGINHYSIGAKNFVGLTNGSPAETEEGACGSIPPFNVNDWCPNEIDCVGV